MSVDFEAAYEYERRERYILEMRIAAAMSILDPEHRYDSLEDAAANRMQQIVALEALR